MAYAPELLILVAIDIYLVMSLLSCLFETHFPTALPYLMQLIALSGFGQLYVSKAFISIFTEDIRFWYSLFYLVSGFVCVMAMNAYLVLVRRKLAGGIIFLGGVTVPTAFSSAFILSVFVNKMPIPLFMMPPIPVSSLYGGVLLCIGILSSGIMLSIRPDAFSKIKIPGLAEISRTTTSLDSSAELPAPLPQGHPATPKGGIPVSDEKAIAKEAVPSTKKKKKRRKKKKKKKKLPLPYLLDQEQVREQGVSTPKEPGDPARDSDTRDERG